MEKKNNGKAKKKEIIVSVISVLVLIIAVIGVSYSIWTQTFIGSQENSINTGYISFSYTESDTNVIDIHNAVPMADENGKKLNGNTNMFDFTVSAKYAGMSSIGYEIYTTPVVQTLDSKYIKVYLTNQNDEAVSGFDGVVPTYDSFDDSSIEGAKTIYRGSLTQSGKTEDYRLRIWVSSDYNVADVSKNFSFKVNVKGMA